MTNCPHHHITDGQQFCFAVVNQYGKHTLRRADRAKLIRHCGCGGNERLCEFKKVGGIK